MRAGLDWTATPSRNENHPYGPCIVGVDDEEQFEAAWRVILLENGLYGAELKGHNHIHHTKAMSMVFELLVESNAQARVLLLDKNRFKENLPKPSLLRLDLACEVVAWLSQSQPLARVLCDDEVRGKREQQEFRTSILRRHRSIHPKSHLVLSFRPSHQSGLIQAADVIAYVCSRLQRGAQLDSEIRSSIQEMLRDNRLHLKFLEKLPTRPK